MTLSIEPDDLPVKKLSFRFDPDFYRSRYADLAELNEGELTDHYNRWGRGEGRVASPLAERQGFVGSIPSDGKVLEIGPFFSPLVRGPNVAYLDILTAEALRARAGEVGGDPGGVPKHIDYLGDISGIEAKFDAILSSHSIEHQPDLIGHLNGVRDRLAANGRYWLIIPDKRYCFDHFIPESTIVEVAAAYHERRTQHTAANILAHRTLVTHNDPGRHWAGDHGEAIPHDLAARITTALRFLNEADGPSADVHAWQFTPASFHNIIETLAEAHLLRMTIEQVFETPHNSAEFTAVLRPV